MATSERIHHIHTGKDKKLIDEEGLVMWRQQRVGLLLTSQVSYRKYIGIIQNKW